MRGVVGEEAALESNRHSRPARRRLRARRISAARPAPKNCSSVMPDRSRRISPGHLSARLRKERGLFCLGGFFPEPLGVGDGSADFLLNAEEGATLAGDSHVFENLFRRKAKAGRSPDGNCRSTNSRAAPFSPGNRLGAHEVSSG